VIPLREQEYLRQKFRDELVGEVRIEHFTQREMGLFVPGRQPCPSCKPARQMVEELSRLSSKIRLRVYEFSQETQAAARWGVDHIPASVIHTADGRQFKYYGVPLGHQFVAFVEGIVDLSRGELALSKDATKLLSRLNKDVHVQVLVAPNCTYSPYVARVLQQMAINSPHVKTDIMDIGEFPRLAERFNIRSVPTVIVDGRLVLVGAAPDTNLAEQIVRAAENPLAPPLSSHVGPSMVQPAAPSAPQQRSTGSGLILP